jgi:hypothetical protein
LDCLSLDPSNVAAHKYAIDAYLAKARPFFGVVGL